MLGIIALAAGAAAAGVLGLAATRPKTFRVQRSAVIPATPEAVHAHLDDFRRWAAWSPWEKMDPGMTRTFSGAARGVGAVYAWEGKKAGAGRMEITTSEPGRRLVFSLDFLKPFRSSNTTEITLRPVSGGTEMTWAMFGPSPLVSRVMGVFMSLDRMIGRDFEAGLANLQALAANDGSSPAPAVTPG